MTFENWRKFFSKEPKKAEQGPIKLKPGEEPRFRFSEEEIEKKKKEMRDQGKSDEEIDQKIVELKEKEEAANINLGADALARKIEESRK